MGYVGMLGNSACRAEVGMPRAGMEVQKMITLQKTYDSALHSCGLWVSAARTGASRGPTSCASPDCRGTNVIILIRRREFFAANETMRCKSSKGKASLKMALPLISRASIRDEGTDGLQRHHCWRRLWPSTHCRVLLPKHERGITASTRT